MAEVNNKEAIDFYLQVIQTDGIDNISKLNTLYKLSLLYESDGDFDNALKYATIASIMTFSPRADICCLIGDIYNDIGNIEWAVKWYINAIGNMPSTLEEGNGMKDNRFFTTIPMLKASKSYYDLGFYDKAKEYIEAVIVIEPENEIALENKKKIDEKIASEK